MKKSSYIKTLLEEVRLYGRIDPNDNVVLAKRTDRMRMAYKETITKVIKDYELGDIRQAEILLAILYTDLLEGTVIQK